jgi:HEAT repeat protein
VWNFRGFPYEVLRTTRVEASGRRCPGLLSLNLIEIGKVAVPVLVEALGDEDNLVRHRVIQVLRWLISAEALETVEEDERQNN